MLPRFELTRMLLESSVPSLTSLLLSNVVGSVVIHKNINENFTKVLKTVISAYLECLCVLYFIQMKIR